MGECIFCDLGTSDGVILANEFCYSIWTDETGVPEGSAMVLPRAHRQTFWDLSEEEWLATRELVNNLREMISKLHEPHGWNIGWNVGSVGGQTVFHAHCHVVPRYQDEPFAGRGIRSWIKDPANRPVRRVTNAPAR